jgi:hypothetical protein
MPTAWRHHVLAGITVEPGLSSEIRDVGDLVPLPFPQTAIFSYMTEVLSGFMQVSSRQTDSQIW